MKQNVYEVEKNVERICRGDATGFLSNNVRIEVENRLKKYNYEIFRPFEEAEKVILYAGIYPKVRLFRIDCYKDDEIKHSAIMGSLFALNITAEMFGDIVKYKDNFYMYLLDNISDLVVQNLHLVGSIPVSFTEVHLNYLSTFKREYERLELIISSLRIDTIISRLIGCNRDTINDKIRNQEIFVNDLAVRKASNILGIGDVFSVRRYGKYRFSEIIGRTKKDNYIVGIDKYL